MTLFCQVDDQVEAQCNSSMGPNNCHICTLDEDIHMCCHIGEWDGFGPYGPCSASCGPGTRERTRTCGYGDESCLAIAGDVLQQCDDDDVQSDTESCNDNDECCTGQSNSYYCLAHYHINETQIIDTTM